MFAVVNIGEGRFDAFEALHTQITDGQWVSKLELMKSEIRLQKTGCQLGSRHQ